MFRIALVILATLAFSKPGDIAEFEFPSEGHRPQAIAPGPDGNLWFAEMAANKIARITPKGEIT